MKKFLVLYRASVSTKERMANASPEQAKAGMAAWAGWGQKTAASLVDMGAPVGDTALLKGTPAPGHIGGYSLVQADSLEAAKTLFDGHPHFQTPGGAIELLELLPM